jgi:hypothetical protein
MSELLKQVRGINKNEAVDDHEISMARGELEAIADKATQLASMLQSKSDEGNPLEAWVQSKITKAKDYITSVSDYLTYNPDMKQNEELEEGIMSNIATLKSEFQRLDTDYKKMKDEYNAIMAGAYKGDESTVEKKMFKALRSLKDVRQELTSALKIVKEEVEEIDEMEDYGLKGTITDKQLQNIKSVWAKKTKQDVTPGVKTMLAKLDTPTKIAIKLANINVLSDLVEEINEGYSSTLIQKAKEIAKKLAGNLTKAYDEIEKIAKGLSNDPEVQKALQMANEEVDRPKPSEPNPKEISEGLSNAQIAQLKKEYEPLKGKTITTSQYQQLKNILFKLQDGDLEKLQKQNIPFASTGAGSILRVRKSPVKITSVKVPGLEGMAEENDYVAVHTKGKVSVTANTSYEAAKKAAEKLNLKGTAGITVMLSKKEVKEQSAYKNLSVFTEKYLKKNNVEEGVMKDIFTMDKAGASADDIAKRLKINVNTVKNILGEQKEELPVKKDEKKESDNKQNAIATKDKEIETLKGQVNLLKQKLENEKNKAVKPEPNPKTGEVPLTIGIAHAEFKKQEDKKKEIKEEKRLYVESITGLKNKAEKSGMPYSILKQVYDRGMAAWKSGHRPGASQQQWAFARVNSFITKSSGTWGGADKDLAAKVKGSK